jgi:glycosyltransferase involved in cell wall biosynthesis
VNSSPPDNSSWEGTFSDDIASSDWVVVVPVLDEAPALPALLCEVRDVPGLLARMVFVDNGSTDGSAALIARAGGAVVTESRRGYDFACAAGVAAARILGARVVVFMEADGSDDPADLPRLVGPVLAGDVDLMVGSRARAVRRGGGMLWHQRAGNAVITASLRVLFGLRVPDNGPFRAVHLAFLDGLDMRPRGFAWTTEMLVKTRLVGGRIAWDETGYRRRAGRSKIAGSLGGTVRAARDIEWTIAVLWWRSLEQARRTGGRGAGAGGSERGGRRAG